MPQFKVFIQANHQSFEYSPCLQRTTATVLTHSVGMLDLCTYRILQAQFQWYSSCHCQTESSRTILRKKLKLNINPETWCTLSSFTLKWNADTTTNTTTTTTNTNNNNNNQKEPSFHLLTRPEIVPFTLRQSLIDHSAFRFVTIEPLWDSMCRHSYPML